jgi:hypothetical protein
MTPVLVSAMVPSACRSKALISGNPMPRSRCDSVSYYPQAVVCSIHLAFADGRLAAPLGGVGDHVTSANVHSSGPLLLKRHLREERTVTLLDTI